jgi:hypothetical protein
VRAARLRDLQEDRHSERVLRLSDLVGGWRRDDEAKAPDQPSEEPGRAPII